MSARHRLNELALASVLVFSTAGLQAQQPQGLTLSADSVSIRLDNSDIRTAIRMFARYMAKPVVVGNVPDVYVSLETPVPVHRDALPDLLAAVLRSHGLVLEDEATHYAVSYIPQVTDIATPTGSTQQELFVIRLSHAQASEVAATVNALYGQPSALGELGTPAAVLSDRIRQTRIAPTGLDQAEPAVAAAGRPGVVTGAMIIVPDSRSNSLLVRASPQDFAVINAAVQELDVRPLQVLIEVLIVEVRRDRGYDLGTDIGMPPTRVPGMSDAVASATSAGLGLGDFALNIMHLGGADLDVTLHAATRRGHASILSRPVVLAANNEAARILVGSQRPFVQVSRSLPTDTPSRDQVIQYRDVGTDLTVVPTVSNDGYVMLSVTQEVNAATAETAFDAPVISTRAVQTRLLVRDGQTAVLGGLADRQRDASSAGIPLLSSIPVIGALFGRVSRRSTETELFLFLTPRVIRSDEDIDELTESYRDRSGGHDGR